MKRNSFIKNTINNKGDRKPRMAEPYTNEDPHQDPQKNPRAEQYTDEQEKYTHDPAISEPCTKFNLIQQRIDPMTNPKIKRILVINSSNSITEYAKWQSVIDCLFDSAVNTTAKTIAAALESKPILSEWASGSDVDEATMTKIQSAFIHNPPSFVNGSKVNLVTDSYGITSEKYINFLQDVFKTTTKDLSEAKTQSASGTHDKRDAIVKKISICIGEILYKLKSFEKLYDSECEYASTNRLGRRSVNSKTFKVCIRHQLSILFASLFGSIKSEKAFSDHCTPLKWTFERISPKHKPTIEIKLGTGLPTKVELAQLLTIKKTKKENDETRIVLADKIAKIQAEETSKITDDDKKQIYKKQIIPGIEDYTRKFFTHKLVREECGGISSMITLLKIAKTDSLLVDFLDRIHDEASKALECKKLSDPTIEVESDGEDVVLPICNHRVKLTEPPTFSEACKSMHKFDPPKYRYEIYGDFIDFIEGPALEYLRKFSQMSFRDRGVAIWWLLKTDRHKNLFMKHFGKFLTDHALTNEKEFQNLYVRVSRKLFPEQDKTPNDYQHQLEDRDWLAQTEDEDFDELLDRIRNCLENAFPNEHTSDVNRVKLADLFYAAIRDRFYQKYIDEHHYDEFFKKGKINLIVTNLNKKKQERLEQSRRQRHYTQNVNAVASNDNQSKHVSFVNQNNGRNARYDHRNNHAGHRQSDGRHNNKITGRNQSNSDGRQHNSGIAEVSELKKEIIFLTRNKNIRPKGGHWFELERIDPKVTNSPGFDIRNYVPEKQYKLTVAQAKINLETKRRSQNVNVNENFNVVHAGQQRKNVNAVRSNHY